MQLSPVWILAIADVIISLSAAAYAATVAIPVVTRKERELSLELLLFNATIGTMMLALTVKLRNIASTL